MRYTCSLSLTSHGSGTTIRSSLPAACWYLMAKLRPTALTLRFDPMNRKRQSGGTTDVMCRICGTRCGIGARPSISSASFELLYAVRGSRFGWKSILMAGIFSRVRASCAAILSWIVPW